MKKPGKSKIPGFKMLINRKRLIFRYDRKIPDYFSVVGAP